MVQGVRSRNGKYRTLRTDERAERPYLIYIFVVWGSPFYSTTKRAVGNSHVELNRIDCNVRFAHAIEDCPLK